MTFSPRLPWRSQKIITNSLLVQKERTCQTWSWQQQPRSQSRARKIHQMSLRSPEQRMGLRRHDTKYSSSQMNRCVWFNGEIWFMIYAGMRSRSRTSRSRDVSRHGKVLSRSRLEKICRRLGLGTQSLSLVASDVSGLGVENEVSVSRRSSSENVIHRQIFTATNVNYYNFRWIPFAVVVIGTIMNDYSYLLYYKTTSIKYIVYVFFSIDIVKIPIDE